MKFLKSIFFMSIFSVILVWSHISADESSVSRGVFLAGDRMFNFEKSYDFINIYDSNDNPVFNALCQERNTLILGFGFSETYNSFFVFKEKFTPCPINFELNMEFENFNVPVINRSDTAFYSPVLVENGASAVFYLSEDFSIVQYDINRREQRPIIKSRTPVLNLSKNKLEGQEVIEFYKFVEGNYRKFFFYTDHVETSGLKYFPCNLKESYPGEDPDQNRMSTGEYSIQKSTLRLDYNKIIAFGDSITIGEINGDPFPELGYVPRLEPLVREQLYDEAEVINEGISSSNTDEGVARIEAVILLHKGKFLLFHLGTNDVINYNLPTSTAISNIEFIIKTALEYNLQPVISTLIPRNGGTREEFKRYRGKIISDGITELSETLNIPLVDFWDTFLNYPESDGGYFSLMSDGVHPSEKGYQLMALEWLTALLVCPPQMPWNISGVHDSRYRITLQWSENIEKDFDHYLIKFGFSPDHLDRTITSPTSACSFLLFPFQASFHSKTYFSIQAFDAGGNGSEFSPVQDLDYGEEKGDSVDFFIKNRKGRIYQ